MEIIYYDELVPMFDKVLKKDCLSKVILLKDSRVLKVFQCDWLLKSITKYSNIETRIKKLSNLKTEKDVIKPISFVYYKYGYKNFFIGYIMNQAKGISLDKYINNLSLNEQLNLENYNDIYFKLASIIRKYDDIVFPDLCSENNIFIDSSNKLLQIIDCDGLQILEKSSGIISNMVSYDKYNWKNSKYLLNNEQYCYTKQLDIRSLTMLYFYYVFNINLSITKTYINVNDEIVKALISLDQLFSLINLKDDDIKHKIWLIFQLSKDMSNEYFAIDELQKIADKYTLECIDSNYGTTTNGKKKFIRRLTKKNSINRKYGIR